MGDQQRPSWLSHQASIRAILLASIGLNLFFAGWLVGTRLVPWGFGPPAGPMQQLSDHLRERLSADGFKTVSQLVRDLESRRRQQFSTADSLRQRVGNALTAEPFDRDAFAKVLNDLNTEFSRQRADLDGRIIDALARLSSDDRRRLSELPLPLPPPPPAAGFGPHFLPIGQPPRP